MDKKGVRSERLRVIPEVGAYCVSSACWDLCSGCGGTRIPTATISNKETDMETKLVVFRGKEIRRTLHNAEWWFSVADVVEVLTDSADPRQYIKKMRRRDPVLDSNWGTICTPFN